jgi:hypothetical protein
VSADGGEPKDVELRINKVRAAFSRLRNTWFVINDIWWPRRISNQELWQLTGQVNMNEEVKRRKYGWIGHTLRKDEKEICHSALEWNPQGKIGEIRVLTKNRRTWKHFTDDLCS